MQKYFESRISSRRGEAGIAGTSTFDILRSSSCGSKAFFMKSLDMQLFKQTFSNMAMTSEFQSTGVQKMQINLKKAVQFMTVLIFLASGSAMAQTGFGLRAGATIDPDQFHFGVHYASSPLIDKLTFRPNLEAGFGSNFTTVAANLEFAYKIPIPKLTFSAYIGAGPALNIYRFSAPRSGESETFTRGGFNILVGLEHNSGLFGELKVGTIDSPDLKFTVGITFK
jgi:hypothetical protein